MAKLYIGNCTHQQHDFNYRRPEMKSVLMQTIQAGGQVPLTGDLSTHDIASIIEQHAKYGLVSVSDIDRTKPFIGLCYSIDKPISVENLRRGFMHNEAVLTQEGVKLREESAVALSNVIEAQTGPLKSLEVSVQEVTPRGDGETETLFVSKNEADNDQARRSGGQSRSRNRGRR